jgi:hypothetical protein
MWRVRAASSSLGAKEHVAVAVGDAATQGDCEDSEAKGFLRFHGGFPGCLIGKKIVNSKIA